MIEVENTDVNIGSQKSHTNEKSHASERLWSESHFRLVFFAEVQILRISNQRMENLWM